MDLDEEGPKSNLAFREVQHYISDIQRRSGKIFSPGKDIFRDKNFVLLMSIAWVQYASGLNFYDDSGRSLLAD